MKWLVIIELRCVDNKKKLLEMELESLIEEIHKNDEQVKVKVFSRVAIDSDFSIHIYHESEEVDIDKSTLALRLVSALREFGLINHCVWVERFHS